MKHGKLEDYDSSDLPYDIGFFCEIIILVGFQITIGGNQKTGCLPWDFCWCCIFLDLTGMKKPSHNPL